MRRVAGHAAPPRQRRYFFYHCLSWPQIIWVTEDHRGNIVGYTLAKMEDDSPDKKEHSHGHITSLAVLRTHRKLGLATKMMNFSSRSMVESFTGDQTALHVRESNQAAFHLYSRTLAYSIKQLERKYYADGEDAYNMYKPLNREAVGLPSKSTTMTTDKLPKAVAVSTKAAPQGGGDAAGEASGGTSGGEGDTGKPPSAALD